MTQAELHYRKMTQTPVERLIVSLSVPTIISMLISNIYNLADTYFVGSLGVSASGAVGVVFTLMTVLQAIGFMLGHGAGSVISRLLAKQDADAASHYASTSFFLAIGVGALFLLLGVPLIMSRREPVKNELASWFGAAFDQLEIAAGFNLIVNAAFMVEQGLGVALCFDLGIVFENLRFVPLAPRMETGSVLVWKKNQALSSAQAQFIRHIRNTF